MSQFDKNDVEAVGLVKFDFLGLTTLTILDWTLRYVRRLDPAVDARRWRRSRSTIATAYRLFAAANTTAVFQFESRGMRDLLKRARPDRFEDIIALVALYRPGPMDLIPDFIERKHGRQRVEYLDPRLEPILGADLRDHGVPGAGDADRAGDRRLQRSAAPICCGARWARRSPRRWRSTATSSSPARRRTACRARSANELFDLMEKFAGYGFNKSHAAAYALVAYQTAYMKAHHPAAFMAANCSAVMDDTDKVQQFHADAIANGLKVLPPDINAGEYRFVPVDARTIRYGLGAIKGTGESAIGAIVKAREEGGPFADLFDFCERIDKRVVNRRVRRGAGARRRVRRASTITARACSPRSASRSRPPSSASATPSRSACSATPTAGRATGPRRSTRPGGTSSAGSPRRRPRSASTSPGIRSWRSGASSRRSSAARSPRSPRGTSRSSSPAWSSRRAPR